MNHCIKVLKTHLRVILIEELTGKPITFKVEAKPSTIIWVLQVTEEKVSKMESVGSEQIVRHANAGQWVDTRCVS